MQTDARLLLAEVYHNLDSTRVEISQLESVFKQNSSKNNLVGYRLGEALFKIGEYSKSLEVFEKTLKLESLPSDRKEKIIFRIACCRFAVGAMAHPVAGNITKLDSGVNTSANEYWPTLSIDGNTLIFTRLLETSFKQEDFYVSKKSEGQWQPAQPLAEINTPENEGAQTLSADGRLMFFSACNRPDGKGSCDIYFSVFDGQQWSQPRNAGAPVCSAAWESQPSYASNSRYLYFASSRPGGKGGTDIWRCHFEGFNPDGGLRWGNAENPGDSINTAGGELSPFIHFNETDLYFSSDGRIGMGGTDIFHSRIKSNQSFGTAENMGYPINSQNNEQGFIIDPKGETGYFASNISGNMDIYSIDLVDQNRPIAVTYIRGKVIDKNTQQPLAATVELHRLTSTLIDTIDTDYNGEFVVSLPLEENYGFNVSKKGYLFYSQAYEFMDILQPGQPILLEIALEPVAEGSRFVLNNIYFETNSSTLLPESKPELDKLANLLVENPGLSIEIEGHTDNTGSEIYNQTLSENRAKAVYDYLILAGIDSNRLSWKGFGFSQPVASNDTEEGKRQNRRTEVKILKL
jgi:outer membrane protein OmpA-like peptidoglycan-associated protein